MKQTYANRVIVDIGGNADERYGYNYKNKELFIKSNKKITGMGIVTFAILSSVFQSFTVNFVESHSPKISPVKWAILTTTILLLLSFVIAWLSLYLSEKFTNYQNFEKVEDIKRLEKLYKIKDKVFGNILIICVLIFGGIGITLGGTYTESGDIELWLIYIIDLMLVNMLVYIYWFYISRARKFRNQAIKELEKRKEKGG